MFTIVYIPRIQQSFGIRLGSEPDKMKLHEFVNHVSLMGTSHFDHCQQGPFAMHLDVIENMGQEQIKYQTTFGGQAQVFRTDLAKFEATMWKSHLSPKVRSTHSGQH